jgi:hypothetical protein
MAGQMINFKELNPFDIMVVEALADPETRPWANDIIDIVASRKKGQITELEADFLLWGIEETRAPKEIRDLETLALTRKLCAEAKARIRTVQ